MVGPLPNGASSGMGGGRGGEGGGEGGDSVCQKCSHKNNLYEIDGRNGDLSDSGNGSHLYQIKRLSSSQYCFPTGIFHTKRT
jgi:hypothetical protein